MSDLPFNQIDLKLEVQETTTEEVEQQADSRYTPSEAIEIPVGVGLSSKEAIAKAMMTDDALSLGKFLNTALLLILVILVEQLKIIQRFDSTSRGIFETEESFCSDSLQ